MFFILFPLAMQKIFQFFSLHLYPLIFLFLSWGVFFLVVLPYVFFENTDQGISSYIWPVSGDWAMHLTQMQSFSAHGLLETLQNNPLYSGNITAYPFVINWFSGQIFSITGGLIFSMMLPLYVLFPFLIFGIYLLVYECVREKISAVLAVFLLFLGGGTAIEFFLDQGFLSATGFEQNAFLESNGYYYKSFFITLLFPQRALFIGISLGIYLLYFFVKYAKKNFVDISWIKILLLGFGMGLLAYIHTHSFLFFALFGFFYALLDYKNFSKYFLIALGAGITSAPFLFFLLQGESIFEPVFHWRWMGAKYQENFFLFWVRNWGVIFILSVILFGKIFYDFLTFFSRILITKKDGNFFLSSASKFFLAGVAVFFVTNLIQFQANPWDNGKIFLWVFLICIISILSFCRDYCKNFFFRLFLLFLSIVSGVFLLIQPLYQETINLFSIKDREIAQEFSEKIPKNALVLTPDYHLFFVSTLTSNSILMGYRGWLGSYGIDYSTRWRHIKNIYEGRPMAKNYLTKYNIDIVVIDSRVLPQNFNINYRFFSENYPLVFQRDFTWVYDVSGK